MGLASIFRWLPSSGNDESVHSTQILPEQWQILADARQKRIPLILFDAADIRGQGFQSLILKLNQKESALYIDAPHPGLPTHYKELPKLITATLKYPGTFQHWMIKGTLVEKASANDGPFYKLRMDSMVFCNDRRAQTRFTFNTTDALITCCLPMEAPIYGDVDNISLGGLCFKARGNLQESNAFALTQHAQKLRIPVEIQLNTHDKVAMNIEVLSMHVTKKPYLHTHVRARFADMTEQQRHILAALTQRSTASA